MFGVLATGFSVLLGFIIFLAFTSYDQSRTGAETEALAVAQQVETAQLFPHPVAARLTGALVCYGRSVVHQEWPRMENGTQGDGINPWGVRLQDPRGLATVDPVCPIRLRKSLDLTSTRRRPAATASTAQRA